MKALAAGAAVLLVGTAGCGGSHRAVQRGCVHVFFTDTGRARMRVVQARIEHDARVLAVRFISKREALAEMKRKNPDLFDVPLPYNPLPDSLKVQTRTERDARVLARTLRGLRGIDAVKPSMSAARRRQIAKALGRPFVPARCV